MKKISSLRPAPLLFAPLPGRRPPPDKSVLTIMTLGVNPGYRNILIIKNFCNTTV